MKNNTIIPDSSFVTKSDELGIYLLKVIVCVSYHTNSTIFFPFLPEVSKLWVSLTTSLLPSQLDSS